MKGFTLNIYVVGVETSFDYRKFPWIKKSRGAVSLKANMQTVVAENAEEAEKKWRDSHSDVINYPALNELAAEGFWTVMCKKPNEKHELWIRELDKKMPLGEYLQYMAPADLAFLKEIPVQNAEK